MVEIYKELKRLCLGGFWVILDRNMVSVITSEYAAFIIWPPAHLKVRKLICHK